MEIRPGITIPEEELELSTARSGGPGGQHVNKTSSKVIVRFDLRATTALTEGQKDRIKRKIAPRFLTSNDVVLVSSERHRDQFRNRQDAIKKLAKVLREALKRPKTRVLTKPSRASKQRRKKDKQAHSKKKRERSRKNFD